MTNKETYRQLCETEGAEIPLFQQYWWMETVCEGKQWDVLLSKGHGITSGALPFLWGKKLGLKYILLPQLTPWGGPWVDPALDADLRHWTLEALAAGLRRQKAVLYLQRFAPGVSDWQPFENQGFTHTTHYTYRFDPLPNPEELPALADRGRKRQLEVVKQTYTIDKQVSAEEFARLHIDYWERRSGHDLLTSDFIKRVCVAALSRGQALLYGLRDGHGTLMAARFAVYDKHCAYALMSAMRPETLRNSMTVLVWTMLTDLYSKTEAFDFEGGTDPGVGHFYSSFGAKKTELHCIYRSRIPFGRKILRL